MEKTNICYLIDLYNSDFTGGGQVHLNYLIKNLKQKHSIAYKIFSGANPNFFIRFLNSFLIIPQIIASHRQKPFNLIHAHSIPVMFPAKILSLILQIPVVVTIHGNNMLDLYQNKKLWSLAKQPIWKYWLEKLILTKIKYHAQITVSSTFFDHSNINKNISLIHNGVDLSLFKNLPRTQKAPLVLFVGRANEPLKGLNILQQAMIKVKKTIPSAKLKIISNLSYSQIPKQLSKTALFVLPSLSEGQPLILLEAWAAKIPVVVTKVGENSKMVKNKINGYLANPGDPDDLADKIITALENPDLKKLGINGYKQVKFMTWAKVTQKTFKIYQKIIQ
jgi:glycosyltransferase involved in cell wall biosynthesis